MQLTGGALARLQAITPAGYAAQIDVTLTDEGPSAQAIVIISACRLKGRAGLILVRPRFLWRTAAFLIAPVRAGLQDARGARQWRDKRPMSVIRNKTKRGRHWRNHPRNFSRAGHRAGNPHLPVSALQYPVRLDEGDAAGRRLPVRVEIFLRLQPLLAAFFAAPVSGRMSFGCSSVAMWWCSACPRKFGR